MDAIALKTINYRGGVVRFRIPASWGEAYGEAGGGTFFAPGDDAGILRLNVLTFKAPRGEPVNAGSAREVLADEAGKRGVDVTPLREGVAMVRFDEPTGQDGEALHLRYWQIAQVLPPVNVRVAMFSYTMLASRFRSGASAGELAVLDEEIAAAEFAPVLGETPAAKKSWWRRR